MNRYLFFWIIICFFGSSFIQADKKTRIWSAEIVATDTTPVKIVARLQYREWLKWKNLPQKKILFYLDGLLIGSSLTESDGIARLLYLPKENGQWTLKVTFEGDSEYKASQHAKNKFRVQIQGTPQSGSCPKCFQSFKTVQLNCLRCKVALTFSEKSVFSIQNSLGLSSSIFFPLERIFSLCWVSPQKFAVLTEKGLSFFDGYEFTSFPFPKNISLAESAPSEMVSLRENEVFFVIASQFVRWTPAKSFESWPFQNLFSQPGVKRLRVGNEKIWILGHKEVVVFESHQLKPLAQIGSILLQNVQDLVVAPNRTLWIAKREGLYFYSERGETNFFPIEEIEELAWNQSLILRTKRDLLRFEEEKTTSILPLALQQTPLQRVIYSETFPVLYFTNEFLYSPHVGKFSLSSPTQSQLPVNTALVYQSNNVWLGTRVGLLLLRLTSTRPRYSLEGKEVTGWGLTSDQEILLGTPQGCVNLKGERVSDLQKMKWLRSENQQQVIGSNEKIVTSTQTFSVSPKIEPILQGIEYQKQFFIVTEHSLYLKEPHQTKLLWNTPAKILTVEAGTQGLFLGTSAGLFRYVAGEILSEAWARNQPVWSVAETQSAIYAGTEQGLFSNQPNAPRWLESKPCLQLFSFQDRLYIRTEGQLYVLQNQKISTLSLSSSPLSIGFGREQPMVLTQRGLEFLPDFLQLSDKSFHFLLPQNSGWIGLSENQLVLVKNDGVPWEQFSLPEKMAGVIPLFSDQYLLWNPAQEWFLWKNQHCKKLESLESFFKNPVTEVREEGLQLVAKTPQGTFVLTASGWEPHTQTQTAFVDNVGKEWKLQGNKLVGPQTTLDIFPADQAKNFVKRRGEELWFFSGSNLISYRAGEIRSYPLKVSSIQDVLRIGPKIYCASARGLFCIEQGEVQTLSKDHFKALEQDAWGNLWGLGDKNLFQIAKTGEILMASEIFDKLIKMENQLYFFHSYRGVFVFDGRQFKVEIPPLQNHQFSQFVPLDKKNGYWVGTQRGLMVYKNARFFPIRMFSFPIQFMKKLEEDILIVSDPQRCVKIKIVDIEDKTKGPLEEGGIVLSSLPGNINDCLPLPDKSILYVGHQGLHIEQHGTSRFVDNTSLRFAQAVFEFENKVWIQVNSRLYVLDPTRNEWISAEAFISRNALPNTNFKSIRVLKEYTFFDYEQELYSFHTEKGMQLWKGPVFQEREKQFLMSGSHLLVLGGREGRLFLPDGRFEPWGSFPGNFKPVAFRYPFLICLENTSQGITRLVQCAQNGTREWLIQELPKEEPPPKIFFIGEEMVLVFASSILRYHPNSGVSNIWSQRKIYGAEQDPSGTLFVLELKGLYRYDAGKMTSVEVPISNSFFIGKMPQGAILIAGAKQLYFLGTNYRLGKKEGFQGPIENIKPLAGDRVLIRYLNQDYSILTQQGMISLESILPIPNFPQETPLLESQGAIWFLQEGNVRFVEEQKLRLCKLETPVHALTKNARGKVFGLSEKGLLQLPEGNRVAGSPEEKIEQILWNSSEILFWSTRKKIGYLQEKESKEIRTFTGKEDVLKIFSGSDGSLFALTTEGLASFSTQHFEYLYRNQSLGNKNFSQGMRLSSGSVFLSDSQGLFQLPKNVQQTIPLPPQISGRLQVFQEQGNLLISTGNGLFRLSPENQLETIYSGPLRAIGGNFYANAQETFEFDGTRLVLKHPFPSLYRHEISAEETLFLQSEAILSQRGTALFRYQVSPVPYGSIIKEVALLPEPYGFCVITDAGISLRQDRCFKIFTQLPFLQTSKIVAKKNQQQLFLWFLTPQGIYRWSNEEWMLLPKITSVVNDIEVYGDSLLVATPEQILQYIQITEGIGQSNPIPFSKQFQNIQHLLRQGNMYWFCAPDRFYRLTQRQLNKHIEISSEPYLSALTDVLGNLWIRYPDRLEYVGVEEDPPLASVVSWEDFYDGKIQVKIAGKDAFFRSENIEFSWRFSLVNQKTEEKWSVFQSKTILNLSAPLRERYRLEILAKDDSGNIQLNPTSFEIDLSQLIFQNE